MAARPILGLLVLSLLPLLWSCSAEARIHGAYSSRTFSSPFSNQHPSYSDNPRAFPTQHLGAFPPSEHYCSNGGVCLPPVFCAPAYLETLYDPSAACHLAPGTPGTCCPPRKPSCEYLDIDPLWWAAMCMQVTQRGNLMGHSWWCLHQPPIKNFLYCCCCGIGKA